MSTRDTSAYTTFDNANMGMREDFEDFLFKADAEMRPVARDAIKRLPSKIDASFAGYIAGRLHNQPEIDALRKENDYLRASLANSGGPCAYCNLPKEKWGECRSGFPGCSRADDAMLCPHVGLELEARDEIDALKREVERLSGLKTIEASFNDAAIEQINRLKAENERLRKDAERYRWLRDPKTDVGLVIDKVVNEIPSEEGTGYDGLKVYEYRAGEELDAAIDAAIDAAMSALPDTKGE